MTTSNRVTKLALLGIAMLFLAATSWSQKPPVAEKLAKTYGLDSFGQIDAIRYTFNLDVPVLKLKLSRSWTWEPKADRVTYEGKDKAGNPVKVTYVRSQLDSQPDTVKKEIDPGFVNDQYWLVFPFHVVWDSGASVEDGGMQKLPVGQGSGQKVVVKYSSGGYTPGDTWELFLGPDSRVKAMAFHHGGDAKPSLVIATWAGYKKAGPLLISTEHHGTADGAPMTLLFTNVAVKLAGSDTWVNAQ
ncbi:MAG TPA: hypothetical protein VH724_09830 [Candidatus Angelobacter sp.]|jgi:hypothetical protein|nr:hypothetical protein [Candidatus Angelobacter sp.]